MSDDLQAKLKRGIAAARGGNRDTGRRLLTEVTDADPDNEMAWFWLALCVNTVAERQRCLERVLAINPNNRRAEQALQQLTRTSARVSRGGSGGAGGSPDVGRLRQLGQNSADSDQQQASGSNIVVLVIILLFVVITVAGALLLLGGDLFVDEEPTSTPTASPVPRATQGPTNTPAPTATRRTFRTDNEAPTLLPTFTPQPTRTNTPLPPPTETPFPLVQMEAFVLSQTLGEAQPNLYRILGDGSNPELIEGEFRDITIDLNGDQVAFIRDVTYEDTEETFPELFIASIDDPQNATQLTDFRTTLMASPSFSPEGQELVFVSNFNGTADIWYIQTNGDGRRRLTEDGTFRDIDPAWRPIRGSREVVFVSDRASIGATKLFRVFIGDPNEPQVIEQLSEARGSSYDPVWSDTGDMIAFISTRRGDPDLYITDDQPGGDFLLTFSDGDAEDRNPDFTPDGRFISFVSNRLDDRFQTYVISLDGNSLTRLTDYARDDILFIYKPELVLRLP